MLYSSSPLFSMNLFTITFVKELKDRMAYMHGTNLDAPILSKVIIAVY